MTNYSRCTIRRYYDIFLFLCLLIKWRTEAFLVAPPKTSTISLQPTAFRPRAFVTWSTTRNDDDEPEDWSEDDVISEFDDDNEQEEDDDEFDDDVIDAADDDDDDDDDDLDEIELDLDEEDDDSVEEDVLEEEIIGEYEEEDWDEEEERSAEVKSDDLEWDEDEDGGDYELADDPDDPNYQRQKELIQEAVDAAEQRARDESFDPMEFVVSKMTEEQEKVMDQLPFLKDVEEQARSLMLTEDDVADVDLEKDVAAVSDLMDDDPYPRHEEGETNILEETMGLTDDDMEELDNAYKSIGETIDEEPWDKVMLKDLTGWDGLSNKTLEEMEDCLGEIGGSAYNVTRWLLYDLDFNVSNLILAAVKHNREAPILLQHWYPQLVTYERYQHARDRNFDFTWDDVESADMNELERYYAGFGYDEIPKKAPAETGIISLEDLDEEEIKMAAFDSWMKEVYNPEWDRKDFDDDALRDEDNVFSEFYEPPQHPDLPVFEDALEDLEEWEEEMGDDPSVRSYRDMMGRSFEYKVVRDEEFEREFRGHLIIACTGDDSDLEIAEKITIRFEKEFAKKVFVETRVMALAREEDNVYEIWLESYEIDLLHSKKRASSNAKGWTGPAEVDDAQIDYLVDRVRFLISDDARYSYRMEMEHSE